MLTYLEGSRFKLHSALLDLDHKPKGSHPLSSHIHVTRDRTGLQQSILKVPQWLHSDEDDRLDSGEFIVKESLPINSDTNGEEVFTTGLDKNFNRNLNTIDLNSVKYIDLEKRNSIPQKTNTLIDRGIADGGSNQPDSDFGNRNENILLLIFLIYNP